MPLMSCKGRGIIKAKPQKTCPNKPPPSAMSLIWAVKVAEESCDIEIDIEKQKKNKKNKQKAKKNWAEMRC